MRVERAGAEVAREALGGRRAGPRRRSRRGGSPARRHPAERVAHGHARRSGVFELAASPFAARPHARPRRLPRPRGRRRPSTAARARRRPCRVAPRALRPRRRATTSRAAVGHRRLEVAGRRQRVRRVVAGAARAGSARSSPRARPCPASAPARRTGSRRRGPPGRTTRAASRQRATRLARELEGVDAEDGVEGRVGERERLHVALAQVGVGESLARDAEQAGADVDAARQRRRARAASTSVRPRAAADVEHADVPAHHAARHRARPRTAGGCAPRRGRPTPAGRCPTGGAGPRRRGDHAATARLDVLVEPEDVLGVVDGLDRGEPLRACRP